MVMGTQIQRAFPHMQNVDSNTRDKCKGRAIWGKEDLQEGKKTGHRASKYELSVP